ncbi:MAG TPA: ABC transporter ATP-binding protein, partial [Alphaproteobacteria bacterium]|nr:ABC transporter ATP-binding protein [Alphaproteobacteria bacterium]
IGIVPVRKGEIIVNGADVTALSSHGRVAKGMAYVPQGRQIFGAMTVEENIRTGLSATGRRDVPDEIYSIFPILWEFNKRRAGNLSGGQQQ